MGGTRRYTYKGAAKQGLKKFLSEMVFQLHNVVTNTQTAGELIVTGTDAEVLPQFILVFRNVVVKIQKQFHIEL